MPHLAGGPREKAGRARPGARMDGRPRCSLCTAKTRYERRDGQGQPLQLEMQVGAAVRGPLSSVSEDRRWTVSTRCNLGVVGGSAQIPANI